MSGDLGDQSMFDLFRMEAEDQLQTLTAGLLELDRNPLAPAVLEACMRAAHSLKGASRIIGVDAGVRVAHAMEDCFVAAQQGRLVLNRGAIDRLLPGVDLLTRIARTPEADIPGWDSSERNDEISALVGDLLRLLDVEVDAGEKRETAAVDAVPAAAVRDRRESGMTAARANEARPSPAATGRVLRVTADNLDQLLALSGEALVESRRLGPFAASFNRLRRRQHELGRALEILGENLRVEDPDGKAYAAHADTRQLLLECQELLARQSEELDAFDRRSIHLSHRLHEEARAVRMRPLADAVQGFPRMVRDLGRSLGKQVQLKIDGSKTQVDRDILEKLEAPLGHLLRNAVDHAIEPPEERLAAGKPIEGTVRLEARHSGGMLQIVVSDDGRGVDLEQLRAAIIDRGHTNVDTAARLTEAELLEFLFLPGFTMKDSVSEISGRGVGLDVVQTMVRSVRGIVRATVEQGGGARFQLQLPLTLSVVRTLLVEIGGEPYALPLTSIARTVRLPKSAIEQLEGRPHFRFDDRQIGLALAQQILSGTEAPVPQNELCVIVVGDHGGHYGLVVDRFLGERELVVQPLDPRLGKIKDVAAAALMDDGSPVLIVDVEDMIRSIDKLVAAGRLGRVARGAGDEQTRTRKRVLVVDDSLTVRELERKLIGGHGYEVEVAVDGMDGWNAVRTGHFHLVVTDVDMPRLDGIELVTLIKKDPNLKTLPVMIVSYKDREADRRRGLEAGADYYLTKGSFHDETLLQAVVDLIGEAGT